MTKLWKNTKKMLAKYNRKLEMRASAVFIYFCTILEMEGYAKGHNDELRIIMAISNVLTIAWILFDTGRGKNLNNSTIEELKIWLDGKLPEVFSFGLDKALCPTGESLEYIMEDFKRISKVCDLLLLNSI